ncbi:MAG TPA: chloride channel protein [Thermoleophilia bacterium]
MNPDPQQAAAPAEVGNSRLLYVHVIVVSLIVGFGVLAWFVAFETLNKLLWNNSFVTAHAWMFPVICLPFSLLVGLLLKYAKAPSNLDGSILDSLTGDVSHLQWKNLPVTVAQALASLFSGAALGPEGAIGNIASRIAAMYCDLFKIPKDQRSKLVFASVASGYNGLLENPVFAAVLVTEVAETKEKGLSRLPAALVGGGVGYGVFLLLHETGFVNFLHLPPAQSFRVLDAFLMVPLALIGLTLAVLTGVLMKAAQAFFGRLKDRVILRALLAGVIFSVVGVFAPVVMFSGEAQVHTLITGGVYALFRTPLMVVLLTAFMLDASATLTALIVLAMATVMIAMPPLQRRIAARQAGRGPASAAATDQHTQGE